MIDGRPHDLETPVRGLGPVRAREAADQLVEDLQRHDHLYYVLTRPEISDDAYDGLFRRLRAVEEAYPEVRRADSPTQRVGAAPQEKLETVHHAAPMLSLDSTQEESEVARFDERVRKAVDGGVRYLLEPKLDGVSIELVYENGVLARAVTRGNGLRGEAVTVNARTIASVPLRLRDHETPAPSFLSVRGEVIMRISAFERFNERLVERGEEPYASPRNSAAGALRQLDSRVTATRELECLAYDVIAVAGARFAHDEEVVTALSAWGFPVPERVALAESVEEIVAYHRAWLEDRDHLDYEIDGIVVKLDDLEARADLGSTSHHPRWALALKFEARKEVTRVERIAVSVGRTGVITPVALLLPVVVGGVTISRASLHNREEVQRKDVREGDRVRIQRAGDVIPQVVERLEDPDRERGPPFVMPKACPACGSTVMERGPFTVCPNRFGCPAQLVGRLVHFGSRAALDIEGLGEETVRLLVDRGLVSGIADLFALAPSDLVELPGFAQKSAQNLVEAIQDRKHPELERFLHALGIPEVGATVARVLAREFGELEALMQARPEDLEVIDGIGPKMSVAIRSFFDDPRSRTVIRSIVARGVVPRRVKRPTETPLAGKRFVFTGGLASLSRGRARTLVEGAGGRVVSSVSGETDYVVVGTEPGSKYDRAVELGVSTLDEVAFLELLAASGLDVHP